MFFETCPAADNPIKSVVKLSTTDDVGRYKFGSRYKFGMTEAPEEGTNNKVIFMK